MDRLIGMVHASVEIVYMIVVFRLIVHLWLWSCGWFGIHL